MRTLAARLRALVPLAVVLALSLPGVAGANPKVKKQIKRQTAQAMEAYDLLEYEDAKKGLASALLLAKRKGLGQDPIAAEVHMYLAIVYFSGFEDKDSARLEFASAIEIQSDVKIPKAYSTKEMAAMFGEIRAEFKGGDEKPSVEPETGGDDVSCETVEGIQHELVDSAPARSAQTIELRVSPELEVGKVALYYRPDGGDKFVQVTMGRQGQCNYVGKIPASAVSGSVLHYYVSVLNKAGKQVAKSGTKFSPNLIEVTAAVSKTDGEDPFESPAKGGEVEKTAELGGKRKRFFVSFAVGSGGGYVTGTTEATSVDVECCFAPALFHLLPEVGYWLSEGTSVSAAVRLGFPVGANVDGHATAAPSGLIRVRHAFGEAGAGFQVSGSVGGGIVRHTVKISNAAPGEDTDTTATGPLLFGAGLGYIKSLGSSLRLLAELNSLVGVPVVDQIGCPGNGCVQPNFGVQFDFNLGLMVAF